MHSKYLTIGIQFGYILSKIESYNENKSSSVVPKPKAQDIYYRLVEVYQNIKEIGLEGKFEDMMEWNKMIFDRYGDFDEQDDSYTAGGLIKSIKHKILNSIKSRKSLKEEDIITLATRIEVWTERLNL